MIRSLFVATLIPALVGCASVVASATGRLAGDVSSAILNQNDPKTVEDGAPAYLLLIDGLIEGDPENQQLLLAGGKLYAAYAGVFVQDAERARRLTGKARVYAARAFCPRQARVCAAASARYDEFRPWLASVGTTDVPALYIYAATWAAWIQANSSNWNAVADLPKVQAAMQRVIELDETYENGSAHLYLGMMATLLPPNLGGKPEEGRRHFERAITLSRGRDLMAKVEFARRYARLVFDRPLHDRLLQEVLAADAVAPGLTLSNTLAQRDARQLLDSANDYF